MARSDDLIAKAERIGDPQVARAYLDLAARVRQAEKLTKGPMGIPDPVSGGAPSVPDPSRPTEIGEHAKRLLAIADSMCRQADMMPPSSQERQRLERQAMALRDAATSLLAGRGGQEYPPVPQPYGKAVKRAVHKATKHLRKRVHSTAKAARKVARR